MINKDCKIYIIILVNFTKKVALKVNDSFIIGSSDSASIIISNPRVSGNHIQFIFDSQGLYIQDLNSLNGTFVNGVKLDKGVVTSIKQKDKIQLAGTNDVIITIDTNLENEGSLSHTDIIDQLRVKKKIYIGRSNECDIVLETDTISRKHAVIEKVENEDVFYIKDLGSVNGTFVNGRKIYSKTRLLLTDVIFIGKYKLSLKGEAKDLSEEIAISATGISKTYNNGYTALKTMNVAVPSKSLLAIMGPTGVKINFVKVFEW